MLIDESDDYHDLLECRYPSQQRSSICRRGITQIGETAVQPVRLVLLLLMGPREGENEVLEFASVQDAAAYGRKLFGDPQFQLEEIETADGESIVGYDHLNDLCCTPYARGRRHG